MSLSGQELRHNLHVASAVFFRLPHEIDREAFRAALDLLEEHAGPSQTASRQEHWAALERRVAGRSPWNTIVTGLMKAPERMEERAIWAEGVQAVGKIVEKRRYTSYVVEGIQYVVDVFNPRNELDLSYAGAGEPVFALLLGEITGDPKQVGFRPLPIRDRLAEVDSFYRILEGLVVLLRPEKVCGGNYLVRVMMAYHDGKLSPETSPWDLLWTLTSVKPAEIAEIPRGSLQKAFCRIMEIPAASLTLLQVVPRFDSVMSREYGPAARLLGRTAVTEVGERPAGGRGNQRH